MPPFDVLGQVEATLSSQPDVHEDKIRKGVFDFLQSGFAVWDRLKNHGRELTAQNLQDRLAEERIVLDN
jgi:hypothetical protein